MPTDIVFAPRPDLLSIDELGQLGEALVDRGITHIRLTGGEPLTRRGIGDLLGRLGRRLGDGLEELTLSTNGSRLAHHADRIRAAGVRRINVSLDSLRPERFAAITRTGRLEPVLQGIEAARRAGLAVKINMVALAGVNDDEFLPMLDWCSDQGFDLTLIETMPMGDIGEDRTEHYLALDIVRRRIEARHRLTALPVRTGGPARYFRVEGRSARLGFITPLTHNFCESCNRVRITATGTVYPCLGQDERVDLRAVLRSGDRGGLNDALEQAVAIKPRGHDFVIGRGKPPAVSRTMSMTGG
jgi:cyclic pyranopterin phosphate synthase